MDTPIVSAVCTPREGMVFPGTWPDCPDCHGNGYVDKAESTTPCQTCQERSAAIDRSLEDLIEFRYYGRPENYVPLFPREDEAVPSAWIDITWAEVFNGTGVHAGTWPDCSECRGLGQKRYEVGWDGHRSDFDVLQCGTCKHRTRTFHLEHPNEKDWLLLGHAVEIKELRERHVAEMEAIQTRHQAELEAFPY